MHNIFEPLAHHLTIASVRAGDTTGTLYGDDTAVLCRSGHRFYLAGDATNSAFNAALKNLFDTEIYPHPSGEAFTLCADEVPGRAEQIAYMLTDRFPMQATRHYYTLDTAQAQPLLPPAGMTIALIDAALLSRTTLGGYDDLVEELLSERASVEDFLARSFGFCVLAGDEIAGMVTSEFNTGTRTELGINTMANFQRRGVATALVAAFAAAAHQRGYVEIGWHCWDYNHASIATALKSGGVFVSAYPTYFALFDPIDNLAVNGETRFRRGEYAESIMWYERAFSLGTAQWWAYYVAAQAYAALGQIDAAFANLERAIERDVRQIPDLTTVSHFAVLHSDARWATIVSSQSW